MQIVIDIPEKIFKELTKYDEFVPSGNRLYNSVLLSIYKGTPLPKGHGRLIDEYQIVIPYDICDGEEAMEFVHDAPTIIEADTEGSDSE